MSKLSKLTQSVLLALVAIVLVVIPVLAAYRAQIAIVESGGTSYGMLPVQWDQNNAWLASNGFMSATALDTRVQTLGGLNKPHMVAEDRTLTATAIPSDSQTNLYFATGETALSTFDVIAGYEGFYTIPDAAALEPVADFEFEFSGYVDTGAGTGTNIVNKPAAFNTFVSGDEEITSCIYDDIWTQVAPQLGGETNIYSLLSYNGDLYGGTSPNGNLYQWNGVNLWVQVAPQLGAETEIWSLVEYNGLLYGGTGSLGNLYEWNGAAWVQRAPQFAAETDIYSLAVYNGKLYGATGPNARLLEWDDVNTWVAVAPQAGVANSIRALVVYDGSLYGGADTGELYRWNDADAWVQVAADPAAISLIDLVVYNDKIYGSCINQGDLFEWNGVDAWVQVAPPLGGENVYSLTVYNGNLYGGTRNLGRLYVWNGIDAWVQVAPQLAAEIEIWSLAEHNGLLYGGTANLGNLYELDAVSVTAVNVPSGEHTVVTTHTGALLSISVDSAVAGDFYDSLATAVAVPNKTSSWFINQRNVSPYMDYYKHTTSDVEHAWYQPNHIVENTGFAGTADAGTQTTLDDAGLTQADDYWIGARLTIVTTTDTLAPQGESSIITDFDATNDRLTFTGLTATVDAGDTYTIDFGTLVDRSYYALDFVPNDDEVNCGADALLDITDKATIEAWVYIDSDGENNGGRIVDRRVPPGGYFLSVGNEAGGNVTLDAILGHAVQDAYAVTNVDVSTGAWHYVVAVYNRLGTNRWEIYVDGVLETLSTDDDGQGAINGHTANSFFVGDNSASARCFDGRIDEVRFYQRAFDQAEVTANYNAGAGVYTPYSTANLEIELHIEDGSGAVVTDTSGNGFDGTIANAAWINGKVERAAGVGGSNDARITWGVNPTGVVATLGSMVSTGQPSVGIAADESTTDMLPRAPASDWNVEPDIGGSLATNPLRPLVTMVSDTTALTERQAWVLFGIILVFAVLVGVASNTRGHHLITGVATSGAIVALVIWTVFPVWTVVFVVIAIWAGWQSERSPSL